MDLQGSKIAITLPTGRRGEFELMRAGTAAEYRELLETRMAREIDDEMVKQKRERTETLLAKLETDKSALEKLVAEIMGTVDEMHEGQ